MPFTSPFGNIAELNFNPSSSQLPQNQKPKPLAQPSQTPNQQAKPMAMPEPANPEAFSTPDFTAMVRPFLFATPQAQPLIPEYTPTPFAMPAMAQPLPIALPQPVQLPQLPQQVQNPNKLIFVRSFF